MATFTDGFDRANGGLGANWNTYGGNFAIGGGAVTADAFGWAQCLAISESGRQEARITVVPQLGAGIASGVGLKMTSGQGGGIVARLVAGWDNWTFQIVGWPYGPEQVWVQTTGITGLPTTCSIAASWDNGHVRAVLADTYVLETDQPFYFTSDRCGMHEGQYSNLILDFWGLGGQALGFTVDPAVVGNYGQCVELELIGTGTAWTSGTPGSPTFTVNYGTISAQEVVDSTHATITYCPGNFLGTAIFTDPSTGLHASVLVTSDPLVVPPGGALLSETAVAYIERSAIAQDTPTILNQDAGIGPIQSGETLPDYFARLWHYLTGSDYSAPPYTPDPNNLPDIYARLWGGEEWQSVSFVDPGTNSIATALFALAASFAAFRQPDTYTIQDMMDNLRGTGAYTHTDIYNALAANVDFTAVLEAIADVKGDPLATIKAVMDMLFVLGGSENNYTLNSVKTWVEAVRGTDLPTIRDVLSKLGTSGYTIDERIDALSSLIVSEATIQGMLDILLTAITGGVGVTLTSVLNDILAAINANPPVGGVSTPLWPGVADVTLGDSVALTDGLVVTGPLHGLLVTVTGHPPGAGKYVFDDVDSWQHVGGVVFCTDNGYYERAESIGLQQQVLVPRTMEVAGSAIFRVNAGWTGTVRPWTRT